MPSALAGPSETLTLTSMLTHTLITMHLISGPAVPIVAAVSSGGDREATIGQVRQLEIVVGFAAH